MGVGGVGVGGAGGDRGMWEAIHNNQRKENSKLL